MFVKVCGTTTEEDALLAVALGADALGFIFAPSPRRIAPVVVSDIVRRLPPGVLTVGVFRDEAPQRIVEIVRKSGLRAAQLHGHESASEARWVRERVPIVIKAFRAGDPAIAQAADYAADVILLDAPEPGSGKVFDWRLVDGVPDGTRVMVAGGLTAANVGEAIAVTRAWGVDVVTGVEQSPGVKHPARLRQFIAAVRATEAAPASLGEEDELEFGAPYDWEEDDA